MRKIRRYIFLAAVTVTTLLSGCVPTGKTHDVKAETEVFSNESVQPDISLEDIPEYSGSPYVAINKNEPYFEESDFTVDAFESYSELDALGRCGVAYANIGIDLMPTEKRESISSVTPSGWKNKQYDFVDGTYLYNRCHLIGFQLTAENANEKNLITGTRYMNVDGMLPFENMVADYIKETENHVLYRVTPVYNGDSLVASGVLMEAKSVEDNGDGICFNVYVYNVQPGVEIDYVTGDNWEASESEMDLEEEKYILNTNSKKYHKESCSGVKRMKDENRADFFGDKEHLEQNEYQACSICNP